MEKDKWIDANETKPETTQSVLVWVEGIGVIKHYYTTTGKWKCMESRIMPKYYECRYWQPLPESPHEK